MRLIPFRRPAGLTVVYGLLVASLLCQIPLLQRAVRLARGGFSDDVVARAEERLRPLRASLAGQRRAGYLTDVPGDSIGNDAAATERYFLTQYVLAPVVLERGTGPSRVIGNFAAGRVPVRYRNLSILKDFGDGLVVFAGEHP